MKRVFATMFTLLVAVAFLSAVPATDAHYLKVEITYHLQSDGSWDMEYQHQVRLETYYAVTRALGETFIVYNPDFQKLEILKAETTMTDGRKVAAPENAFNEVLPAAAHGFADFSHLREMVVTHTGLERGAMVELHYRIRTRAGFMPAFSGREILNRDFPIEQYKLAITVPDKCELRYRVFGHKAEAEISGNGAEKIYTLALAGVQSAAHEALAPGQAGPFIVFSTAVDWPEAMKLSAADAVLPAWAGEKIGKLQAQFRSRPDLLAALQKLAAAEIQNCVLGPDMVGWPPRPLERVASSNYGTKLEKALLLRAMLRKSGLEAQLLAVAAGVDFAADVPSVLQLGEFWLKVADGSHVSYLDPCHEQDEFSPTRCQKLAAFNMASQILENLPAADWGQNGVDIYGSVNLAASVVSGNLTVAARGIFNRYGEASENGAKFVEGLLKKIFPIEKAEIKKLLVLNRHEFQAEVAFSGKWLKDAGAGFFCVGNCRLPGLPENIIQLNTRETPLLLEAPFKISLNLDLQPAAGLSLDYSAPQADVTNEVGYFSRSHSLEKNGHIRFSESCGILNNPVRAESYPRLRELFKAYFTPDFWLVFKKEK